MIRPALWFATAYTIVIIVHEAAHALTGVALRYPSTLFNFWVNHQVHAGDGKQRAVIFAAGPTASLLAGVVCWVVYQRTKNWQRACPFSISQPLV